MKIKIDENHREKITEAIKTAEGRATARTITFENIIVDIEYLERRLNIPKKYMEGIKARIDHHAQNFPNAYRWTPESTQYIIERKRGGWYIVDIFRDNTRRENHGTTAALPEATREAIIESMTEF